MFRMFCSVFSLLWLLCSRIRYSINISQWIFRCRRCCSCCYLQLFIGNINHLLLSGGWRIMRKRSVSLFNVYSEISTLDPKSLLTMMMGFKMMDDFMIGNRQEEWQKKMGAKKKKKLIQKTWKRWKQSNIDSSIQWSKELKVEKKNVLKQIFTDVAQLKHTYINTVFQLQFQVPSAYKMQTKIRIHCNKPRK